MSKKKIKNRRNDYEGSNMYMFHNERYDIQGFLLMLINGMKQ